MGYSTSFDGHFTVAPPLRPEHAAYLKKFAATRRMRRDPVVAANLPDPIRIAAGLPIGKDAGYFTGALGYAGQDQDESVRDFDTPPFGQPGLHCQWVPSDDGSRLFWNGSEKFYHYTEWLAYITSHFLFPWGYEVSGHVNWQGEDMGDIGYIEMKGTGRLAVPVENLRMHKPLPIPPQTRTPHPLRIAK